MNFDLDTWKQKIKERLPKLKSQMGKVGAKTVYGTLCATVLWPLADAYTGGGVSAFMPVLQNVAAGVGSSLLANLAQRSEDDAIRAIEKDDQQGRDLREALDDIIRKLDVVAMAKQEVDKADLQWFEQACQTELARFIGRDNTTMVQGNNGVMANNGGVAIGQGSNNTIIAGSNNVVIGGRSHRK